MAKATEKACSLDLERQVTLTDAANDHVHQPISIWFYPSIAFATNSGVAKPLSIVLKPFLVEPLHAFTSIEPNCIQPHLASNVKISIKFPSIEQNCTKPCLGFQCGNLS